MKGLTDKQKAILSFIAESKENTGVFPSLSEIAEHFSFSTPAAYYALSALEEKGYLSHEKGEHRAYILSGLERANRENTAIPLFSTEISERDFIQGSSENIFIAIADKPALPFAFKVLSNSMRNIGILPGDIAIMDRDISSLKDGDIVLAGVNDEDKMDLRRYRKTPSFIQLDPENDIMGIIKGTDIKVFAILRSIRRYYK